MKKRVNGKIELAGIINWSEFSNKASQLSELVKEHSFFRYYFSGPLFEYSRQQKNKYVYVKYDLVKLEWYIRRFALKSFHP